jgi:hypothetical protein
MKPINLDILLTVYAHLRERGTRYRLGAKAPSLGCDTREIGAIDCSGFVRYALAKASGQGLILPDGSVNQHDWCRAQGLHQVDYNNLPEADSSRLFIAFIEPNPVGHVWLETGGLTLESHGGSPGGPDRRAWDTGVLLHSVSACYELPTA